MVSARSGERRAKPTSIARLRARSLLLAAAAGLILAPSLASGLAAQSLRGSSVSLDRQNNAARQHDFTYLRNSEQVRRFVVAGYIVPVRSNGHFYLHDVSYPYARPEVRLFVDRLARQYSSACGEQLVVTSLTRPISDQPANASDRSVHPTGMAVDLRYPRSRACRSWLEGVLLHLEGQGVVEATRETSPAHYHVVVFPNPYASYVERITKVAVADPEPPSANARTVIEEGEDLARYEVRRGDSLWSIARSYGITVQELRDRNGISGSRIYAGQVIEVPVRR